MLQIQNLTISHQKDLKTLVKDLSITIQEGDKVAIIGEEGTGKSSLLTYLAYPNQNPDHLIITGQVRHDYHRLAYLPQILPPELAQQSITSFLYDQVVFEQFDFNLLYQLAGQVGFDSERFDDQVQTMAELSGGERLKIQLIKLLVQNPDLLLLDEPSSDLDLATLKWLETFIKNSPLTIIFISHDEAFLSQTANKIIHFEKLKKGSDSQTLVASLDYQTYQNERQANFVKQAYQASKERMEHRKQMDKLNQHKSAVHHAITHTKNSTEGRLLKKKMKTLLSREKRFSKEAANFTAFPDNPDLINLRFSDDITTKGQEALIIYDQETLATGQNCQLAIHKQDKLAIIGNNGIGKSLLLKKIYHDLREKGHRVGYMPQSYQEMIQRDSTVIDFLKNDKHKEEDARLLLASLNFHRQEICHAVRELSGGQIAKLILAKMVLDKNPILILDEPTRFLAPTSQPEIRRLLSDYKGTLITVSHDRRFIREVCDKVYQLDQEQLIRITSD